MRNKAEVGVAITVEVGYAEECGIGRRRNRQKFNLSWVEMGSSDSFWPHSRFNPTLTPH
jgi:hypothetical protein